MDLSFYHRKKVFLTGHTGFKGAWMSKVLLMHGANIVGYSLEAPTEPNLFKILQLEQQMVSVLGDIRDLKQLTNTMKQYQPEIVIHMAAQPIVRESYQNPVYTYETNVMGTVNVLEAVRQCNSVKSFINVTTDKVYQNHEWEWGYREIDRLNGYDPYSNSKSCSELVTNAYKKSFFQDRKVAISTCRAGNVIGGGDFAKDRIIPDCVRAMERKDNILVHNPYSIRPYQHVLEPVCTYLELAEKQYQERELYEGCYNIGPDNCDCVSTGTLADLFCQSWGEDAHWVSQAESKAPHEANYLKLDCSKIKQRLNWQARWHIAEAVEKTVEWSKAWLHKQDMSRFTEEQIDEFLRGR